jgi:SSS family solute:Na+ symporter
MTPVRGGASGNSGNAGNVSEDGLFRVEDPLLFIACFGLGLLALLLFAALGTLKTRSADDFVLAGRQAGSWRVAGAIMGTLVGGASTIGTAQIAFLYGLSAWWFTLGAGLACLVLAVTLAGPLRQGQVVTIPEFLCRYHGRRAQVAASLFSALGMFVHIVAQLLACGALLASLCGLTLAQAVLVSALLVALVALAGGMGHAGPVGLVKLLLLYITMVGGGLWAFTLAGGWAGLTASFAPHPWFSLFGYGVEAGLADLLSMLVGVLSTQVYLQAVFTARGVREARRGALLSATLIPPLGLFGIAVGLFMRQSHPDLFSAQALPVFLLEYLPAPLAGLAFAVLLFAAVGTASGLTLGVGTTLQADILERLAPARKPLARARLVTAAVLLLALLLVLGNLGSYIMQWSFLSMGLRGAAVCLPLLAATLLGERTTRRGGALSIFLAAPTVLTVGLFSWTTMPPLYVGLLVSALAMTGGWLMERARAG